MSQTVALNEHGASVNVLHFAACYSKSEMSSEITDAAAYRATYLL